MFDDKTYEAILEEVLALAPPGVDTRQGSIFYDAVAGVCYKIANYYADLSYAFDLVFIATTSGEYLDQRGSEYGVHRNPATPARYEFVYEGTQPPIGERFFANSEYFVLVDGKKTGEIVIEAETPGTHANNIPSGTLAVPVNTIAGLNAALFGNLIEPGTSEESDDDFRQRIREKISGPADNGNRQHYKTWCEEISGVGRARILPLWNGNNTVKGVLVGADGKPAASSVVARVQEYIDPGCEGLGKGVANIGAFFTAVSATELSISVAFNAQLASSSTPESVRQEATEAITEHLKELALTTPDGEPVIVRIATIGAILYNLPSIIDYSELTINGKAVNIEVSDTEVAVLQEVTIHVTV